MKDLIEFASHLFLFSGVSEKTLSEIFLNGGFETKSFSRTEIIYSPSDFERKVGFVISGKCEVRKTKSDGTAVVLNILEEYDSFGVLTIFSESEKFPTQIYASKNSEILFMSKETVLKLVEAYPTVAMNVIRFLADRVAFLNKKIGTFSYTRVEGKLASFLIAEYSKYKTESIPFNCKKTAEALNVGRASIYRALDSLAKAGYISVNNKKIIMINPKGLERISK